MYNTLGLENGTNFIFLLDLGNLFYPWMWIVRKLSYLCAPGNSEHPLFLCKAYRAFLGSIPRCIRPLSGASFYPWTRFLSIVFPYFFLRLFFLLFLTQPAILGQCLPLPCLAIKLYFLPWLHTPQHRAVSERNSPSVLLEYTCRIILTLPFSVCHLQLFTLNCSSERYLNSAFSPSHSPLKNVVSVCLAYL